MKSICLCCLLACALFVMSCDHKNYLHEQGYCTAAANGDTVLMEYDKPVSLFTGCADSLQARVTSITDSRCPEGVTCVWAGKLDVVLQMGSLVLNLEKDKVVDTAYLDNHYSFNLVNAYPLPTQAEVRPQQTVKINIIRSRPAPAAE